MEGYFELKPLGPTRVKGASEPVNVHEVTGLGPLGTRLQASARRGPSKFVGRDAEPAQMKRALELVKKGLSPDFCCSSAMHILLRLADRSFHGGDDITSWTMARELGVAEAVILPILIGLKQGGFVIEADASSGTA